MNFPSRGEKKKDKKGALILPQTLYKYSSKLFSSGLQKFADVTAVITYGTPNPGLANCCQCTPFVCLVLLTAAFLCINPVGLHLCCNHSK